MRSVHRFTLEPVDKEGYVTIELPKWNTGACSLLGVAAPLGVPTLWVLLDTKAPRVPWLFKLVRTGENADDCYDNTYVGTVIVDNHPVHIFRGVR